MAGIGELVNDTLEEWVYIFMKWIAGTVLSNKKEIEAWVEKNKKNNRHPSMQGLTRDRTYNAMMEMEALLNALKSFLIGLLPGPLAIPAAAADTAAEWTIKAEMIYAIEYLYGNPPENEDDFAADILMVADGVSPLDQIISDATDKLLDNAKDVAIDLAMDLTEKAGKAVVKKLLKKPAVWKALRTKIGKKLLSKFNKLKNGVQAIREAAKSSKELTVVTKILSAAVDGVFAYGEIVATARDARVYCFKFPKPAERYFLAGFGAVLDFNGNGSVVVKPSFPSNNEDFDIREWVTLGSGTFTLARDELTIKFGRVSWEKSNYNAPCPGLGDQPFSWARWNFLDVEPLLSNKVVKCRLTGECRFEGPHGQDSNGVWMTSKQFSKPTKSSVMVSFKANGGSAPNPSFKDVTVNSPYGEFPDVSKEGHTLDGWFTKDGTPVKEKDKVPDKDHTLYAHWKLKTVKVSFDARGVTPNPSSRDVTFGSEYGTLPIVAKDGQIFLGWYYETSGGSRINSKDKMEKEDNHTLYAHWSRASGITVTFNPNGGNASPTTKNLSPGSTYGTLPHITKPGSRFHGWFTEAKGGIKIESTTVFTGGNTLYAHWIGLNDIIVSFDARGPGNPEDKVISKSASTYGKLPVVARNGFNFDGWFTGASGGTKVESTTKAPEKDHKLYAHWSEIPTSVKVTFNANGGSKPSSAIKELKIGSAYGTLPTVARSGYDFGGWFDKASGGAEVKSTSKAPEKDHTLYAHWSVPKPTSVKVTFNANGGKPSPASKKLNAGTKYETLPKVTKDGYIFGGWFDKASGGTEVKSTSKAPEKDHTLYAHWSVPKPISVKVTFDANGGKALSPASKSVNAGSAYGPLPTVARSGYKFEGWSTAAKSGTQVKPSTKAPDKAHTLYAYWAVPKPVTKKTVTKKTDTKTVKKTDTKTVKKTDTKTVKKTDTKTVKKTDTKTYTVSFSAVTCTTPAKPQTKTVKPPATRIDSLPTPPTRKDYTFVGWHLGDGKTAFTASTPVKRSICVYPTWKSAKPIIYKVSFRKNIVDAHEIIKTVIPPAKTIDSLPAPPTRKDYTFVGWRIRGSEDSVFTASTPVTKSIMVLPKWKKNG